MNLHRKRNLLLTLALVAACGAQRGATEQNPLMGSDGGDLDGRLPDASQVDADASSNPNVAQPGAGAADAGEAVAEDGGIDMLAPCEGVPSGDCSGALETKLTQIATMARPDRNTRRLFDSGLFLSVGKKLKVYALTDLTHPLHETVGFSPVYLWNAVFRAGTLVVQREDENELIVYELTDGTVDPIERARIPTRGYTRLYLHKNGKTLLVEDRNANDESVMKLVDLTVREQPTELTALALSDCEGTKYPSDNLLVLTACSAASPGGFLRNRAYDVSVPSAPALVAEWVPENDEMYLGAHAGALYLQRGNVVRRRALVSGTAEGLGAAELLNVPQDPQIETTFAFGGSSVFYLESPKTGTAQRLCELTAASPTPRCFPGLVPADEVVSGVYARVDGDELMLIGQEYARHVDLTSRDAPVLGERWLELTLASAQHIDGKHMVVSTSTGAAVLDPNTLSIQGFAPLDREVNYCVASDGHQVFARTRDGEFNVLSMDDKGELKLLHRERVLSGLIHKCSIVRRGAQRYFVAISSDAAWGVRLTADGQVDGYTLAATLLDYPAISDNGERLFVTDVKGRAVRELDLERAGITNPLVVPISKAPTYPILATADTLYLRDGSLQQWVLSTGVKQAIPDTQNTSALCTTDGLVFGVEQGSDPFLIEGVSKVSIQVQTQEVQKRWYKCLAGAQRLVLDDGIDLYVFRIDRE